MHTDDVQRGEKISKSTPKLSFSKTRNKKATSGTLHGVDVYKPQQSILLK